MFKKLIKKWKTQKEEVQQKKYYEVRQEWIEFFKTRRKNLQEIDVFDADYKKADQQMAIIMANSELDTYYRKVMNYKKKNDCNCKINY